ncbi:hypothetical protein [Bacteroides zhangwenhongii]|uniref:hypothetical protein n=1 Tax=Bacteroides zhangwenhongii TaxID=2650157 RepID=UPI0022E0110B|nr:hypothetical protein [Bacteroides zhangwenhongii]
MIKDTESMAVSAFLQQFINRYEEKDKLQSLLEAFGYKLPLLSTTCNNMNQILLNLSHEIKKDITNVLFCYLTGVGHAVTETFSTIEGMKTAIAKIKLAGISTVQDDIMFYLTEKIIELFGKQKLSIDSSAYPEFIDCIVEQDFYNSSHIKINGDTFMQDKIIILEIDDMIMRNRFGENAYSDSTIRKCLQFIFGSYLGKADIQIFEGILIEASINI